MSFQRVIYCPYCERRTAHGGAFQHFTGLPIESYELFICAACGNDTTLTRSADILERHNDLREKDRRKLRSGKGF